MNNNFQLIIVQGMDSYNIETMFLAPKSLDSTIVLDYIIKVAEEHDGDIDVIAKLVTEKFGLIEMCGPELFA